MSQLTKRCSYIIQPEHSTDGQLDTRLVSVVIMSSFFSFGGSKGSKATEAELPKDRRILTVQFIEGIFYLNNITTEVILLLK